MKERLWKHTYVNKWRVDVVVFFVTPEHYSWVINCNVKKEKEFNEKWSDQTLLSPISSQGPMKASLQVVQRAGCFWDRLDRVASTFNLF